MERKDKLGWEALGKRKVKSVKVNVVGEIDFEIPKNDQRISMS